MVTIRGREVDVSRFTYELLVLDMDAVETYRLAAERITDAGARRALREFMQDHERHVFELSPIVERLGSSAPPPPDLERIKAKLTLSRMGGDRGVLAGLKAMEDATNLAYGQGAADEALDDEVRDVVERGLEDERRHRAWLEERIEELGLPARGPVAEGEELEELEAETEEVDAEDMEAEAQVDEAHED